MAATRGAFSGARISNSAIALIPLRALLLSAAFSLTATGAEIPRAPPGTVGLSQERLDRVTRALKADVECGHWAGAVGVVDRKGKITYRETVGLAGKAMRDDTIFRIHSMTKPILGVALVTLYEEGALALLDPVKNDIPELGELGVLSVDSTTPSGRAMTVQDLMRIDHIADIPRASSVSRPGYGLRFAIHSDPAKSSRNGSAEGYNSSGLAGTILLIDPAEAMIGLYTIRAPLRASRTAGYSLRGWGAKRLSTTTALRGDGDRSRRCWQRERLHCHAPI